MARRRAPQSEKASAQDVPGDLDFHAAPRAAQALRLRRLGYTYAQIAPQCGFSDESGARKAIKKANARIIRDEAQALVGWQLDMIDHALQIVLKRITADTSESLWAVDRLVPLLKRQAELMGLDKKDDATLGAQVIVREYPPEWIQALPPAPAVEGTPA